MLLWEKSRFYKSHIKVSLVEHPSLDFFVDTKYDGEADKDKYSAEHFPKCSVWIDCPFELFDDLLSKERDQKHHETQAKSIYDEVGDPEYPARR